MIYMGAEIKAKLYWVPDFKNLNNELSYNLLSETSTIYA